MSENFWGTKQDLDRLQASKEIQCSSSFLRWRLSFGRPLRAHLGKTQISCRRLRPLPPDFQRTLPRLIQSRQNHRRNEYRLSTLKSMANNKAKCLAISQVIRAKLYTIIRLLLVFKYFLLLYGSILFPIVLI